MTSVSKNATELSDRFIRTICRRVAAGKRVRRSLPIWGRVHIDRPLPFLCVYRRPTHRADQGTDKLVTPEGAYVTATDDRKLRPQLRKLIHSIAQAMVEQFGAYLVVEVWSSSNGRDPDQGSVPSLRNVRPRFCVTVPKGRDMCGFVEAFDGALSRIRIRKSTPEIVVSESVRCAPPGLPPLLAHDEANRMGCVTLGLEVAAVYRDPVTGAVYPLVLRDLRQRLTGALRKAFYEFACTETIHKPAHYNVLGPRAFVKAVWEVDRRLAEVSNQYDFLLQVTPVNAERAWHQFKKGQYQKAPTFHYRPLPVDPMLLKRQLHAIPVERIEDPAVAEIFHEKLSELDRQITMLQDMNTPRFVHGSMQLFGSIDGDLVKLAESLLDVLPPRSHDDANGGRLDANAIADLAEKEIDHYRRQWQGMGGGVDIRGDIASGLMVSRGKLLISRNARVPGVRAEALLQHEIGTHMLTYYNGRAQPFRQLYCGLAGYEALQEGLAVMAEYLVGGLSRPRLRLLAARVLAAQRMVQGASFVEIYNELDRRHDFEHRTAFTITTRIYRGGGLTKDAVYLKGLVQVLKYLGDGGELEPLYVGKIAAEHVPVIHELRWRQVLHEPPLRPRFLGTPGVNDRLKRLRHGVSVLDLVERRSP